MSHVKVFVAGHSAPLVVLVILIVRLTIILIVRTVVGRLDITKRAVKKRRRCRQSRTADRNGANAYRQAIRQMRKYQKRFRACSRTSGANTWYFIHQTIHTPSLGSHRLEVSLMGIKGQRGHSGSIDGH